jgi:hypothetical protein
MGASGSRAASSGRLASESRVADLSRFIPDALTGRKVLDDESFGTGLLQKVECAQRVMQVEHALISQNTK